MNYPEFNVLSIVTTLISLFAVGAVYMFVTKAMKRVQRLERKTVEIIKSFSELHDSVVRNRNIKPREKKIKYMEGDIDLVKEGKKATFKAIYYPKKITKQD